MNFQSMEYFAAVAKNRSFTRAADALHITQQTLSAHIAGIERELGCPLLIRHIPLELTYAGEVFLRYATEFNTKYDCMLHEFGDILNNQTGKLRIGIAFTRGHAIMPELIAACRSSNDTPELPCITRAVSSGTAARISSSRFRSRTGAAL